MFDRNSQHDSAYKNHRNLFHVEHGHVPGIHDTQNWKENDRNDGSDRQWKRFRHPVDGHQNENIGRSTLLQIYSYLRLFIKILIN